MGYIDTYRDNAFLDVKYFGIDPFGIKDSTAGFQNAINDKYQQNPGFDAVSGALLLPFGTYLISNLTLTYPIALIGLGWGTVIKLINGANSYIFSFTPPPSFRMTGAVFANLKLDCNAANQTATSGGIDGKGACYCLFDHVWFEAPYTYGLSLHDDNLGGFGHHNFIRHCWFHNGSNNGTNPGVGLNTHNSDENRIEGNIFEQMGSPGGSFNNAAYFDDAGLQSIIGNVFVANPNINGIEQMKLASTNYNIVGNIFDGGTGAQIELSSGASNARIAENIFYRPINNSPCVLLSAGTNYDFDGNSFESSPTANASKAPIDATGATNVSIAESNKIITNGSWSSASLYINANTQYRGSGVPASTLGNNGDYYYRTDTPGTANQRLYVKSAGAWSGIL